MVYLAACTMYRDHAHDLREWIEFDMLVGAERFFLYDNGSVDDHREVLAPYVEEGSVVVHDWPDRPGLRRAFDHCLQHHLDDARWIAFIDIDEFVFSPTQRTVTDLLTEYEDAPGVGVNRYNFGTSGHRTRPPGLVIENFVMRAGPRFNAIKTIVDPKRTSHSWGGHNFAFRDGVAVDELHRPLDDVPPGSPPDAPPSRVGAKTPTFTLERLRINHYVTKSEEEMRAKHALPRPDTGQMRKRRLFEEPEYLKKFLDRYSMVRDEDIQVYVPALRAALARREAETSGRA